MSGFSRGFRSRDPLVQVAGRKPVFDENVDGDRQMLEVLLKSARKRGVRVVPGEVPLSKEIVGDGFNASLRTLE